MFTSVSGTSSLTSVTKAPVLQQPSSLSSPTLVQKTKLSPLQVCQSPSQNSCLTEHLVHFSLMISFEYSIVPLPLTRLSHRSVGWQHHFPELSPKILGCTARRSGHRRGSCHPAFSSYTFVVNLTSKTGLSRPLAYQIVSRVRESLDYVDQLDPSTRVIVRSSYEEALQACFWFTVALAACAFVSSLFVKEKALAKK